MGVVCEYFGNEQHSEWMTSAMFMHPAVQILISQLSRSEDRVAVVLAVDERIGVVEARAKAADAHDGGRLSFGAFRGVRVDSIHGSLLTRSSEAVSEHASHDV